MKNKQGFLKLGALGFQHVLAMYAGAVVVPLIVGPAIGMNAEQVAYLISIDLFTCGIASLLQVMGGKYFGVKLPILMGCAFQAVGPMIAIGKMQGITAVYGSIIASGIIVLILSQFMNKIIRFFPPVVTGSVVTIIGASLIGVAMGNIVGQPNSPGYASSSNLFLAALTFVSIVLMQRFFTGYLKSIAVLLSLVVGTAAAFFMGMVDFSTVGRAGWFHMVTPLRFGMPTFHITAIISMVLVGIVSMIESTGVFFALADVCGKKLDGDDIKRGLRAEGLAQVIGGIFQAFPYSTFSQNVGLVALTGVKTRKVVVSACVIIMGLGLLPKVAALTTIIPNPVLGGAMIPMFGMVLASGIKQLTTVNFKRLENMFIVAVSVGVGLGVSVTPAVFAHLPEGLRVIMESGIVSGSLIAIFLNLLFNGVKGQRIEENTTMYGEEQSLVS
ncbi:nucleobase:cation symporter-2 family protein [Aneurinibacillus sp. Ricciae_BoGa-3]|uniref:nucleobase:cation symporter-2 family protein n=1 Tax=Aneurinibacillus sp. Ricciae_BoGa-3 TaxID=3022697 RepID=UPI00233FC402|nr:nucleobase:cation symporter-2 family protein [Aneurinibacillus sp. Ricciae_BoGa-3]WCK53764.1 nucleobase:cation symporter-2 family protein [Aneurinibacillus sp. Ricciae_BoGa-3]